jgi:hypothetical protein
MDISERKDLRGANFKEDQYLSFYQLSKVKTLYAIKLDEELFIPLKKDILSILKNLINDLVSQNNKS